MFDMVSRQSETIKDVAVTSENKEYLANRYEILCLGIITVIGGQFFEWNVGLRDGFGSFATAQILTGVAFICLILCLAEMASAMPLKGGSFAVGRVCLGFYGGYVIGCFMFLECAITCAVSVNYIAEIYSTHNASIYWAICTIFYSCAIAIVAYGGRPLWCVVVMLAVISLVILWIYILGSLQWVNFSKYAAYDPSILTDDSLIAYSEDPRADGNTPWALGGFTSFMTNMPIPTAGYSGTIVLHSYTCTCICI